MKTKNKLLTAIVLCTLFLVALPGIGIATAQEDDYTLDIYGNANLDDTIDVCDITYTARIFFGLEDETALADANNDTYIDTGDMWQEGLIILGRESELTIVDANGDDVTVSMPLGRIVVLNTDVAEAIRALGAKDRIVGVTEGMTEITTFFPDLSENPSVGKWSSPDIEEILALNPDTIFAFGSWPSKEKLEDKLVGTGIVVVRLEFYKIDTLRAEMDMLGYLLGERENALEYLSWHDEYVGIVDERVSGLAEDDKPDVFLFMSGKTTETTCKACATGTGMHELCERAGGKNIAAELEKYPVVEAEWVIQQDIERGIGVMLGLTYKGGYETDDASTVEGEYNKIIEMPGFNNITAVINNKVYLIEADIAFAPVQPVALIYTAKWFHPTMFDDLDPQLIHQGYVDEFCGIDYDVAEHGVFVYP